jgi:hypothetical protein
MFFQFGFDYEGAIWFFRGAFLVVPVVVYVLTRRICEELARERAHPLRGWSGALIVGNRRGGYSEVVPPAFDGAGVPAGPGAAPSPGEADGEPSTSGTGGSPAS